MVDFNDVPNFEPSEIQLEGNKTTLDAVVNQPLAFVDINIYPSSFYEGNYASVQAIDSNNEKLWFRTGSKVLIAQLSELKEKGKLPIKSTIKKIKRYYTLS